MKKWIALFLTVWLLTPYGGAVFAATLSELSRDIESKQAELDNAKNKIEQYERRIAQIEGQQQTLANEIAILENRIKKTRLDMAATGLAIQKTELEVQRTQVQMDETQQRIAEGKELMEHTLRSLYQSDETNTLQVVFGHKVFSDFFDQLEYLETIESDLKSHTQSVQALQEQLGDQQAAQLDQRARYLTLREDIERSERRLQAEQTAKEVLLAEAQSSEDQFVRIVRQLSDERDSLHADILTLQDQYRQRLQEEAPEEQDLVGPTTLSWPVTDPIITATFHDPTYPFRHLFEHSGVDMAVPQGTSVRATASGYVAWTKSGTGYGNYVLIIHPDGVATLHAHLSKILVQPDQFVQRGDEIAKSGGLPGTPGAGFSTGPHLHFEVREDGIPVDPFLYLMDR